MSAPKQQSPLCQQGHTLRCRLRKFGRMIRFVVKRFWVNDGLYRAAALTFSTLLAIVPLMSVAFSLLSAFPVFQGTSDVVQNFVFENFVPATGKVVQTYLQTFSNQASRLSVTGISFLFLTAISVMFTIEDSLNSIWRVRVRRKGVSAFLMYWAVLTLAPILLGLSLALSTYLASFQVFHNQHTQHVVTNVALNTLPFIFAVASFTFLFAAVPNCRVALRHAFAGGLFSATLFQLAKWLFIWYVTAFDTYELLYGAFAIIPLFFLWIYYVWLIILIGAEVAHALSAGYIRRLSEEIDGFTHAVRWLHHLWQAQIQGETLSLKELIELDPYNYQNDPDEVIAVLIERQFVRRTHAGKYVLARDLSRLSLGQLYGLLPWKLPASSHFLQVKTPLEEIIFSHLEQIESNNKKVLETKLCDVYRQTVEAQ